MDFKNVNHDTLLEPIPHGTPLIPMEEKRLCAGPDREYPSYLAVELHWHPEIEFVYIEEGTFQCEVNLDSEILTKGDFMFADTQDLHSIKSLEANSISDALIFHPKLLAFSYEDALQKDIIKPLVSGVITFPHYLKKEDKNYEQFAPLLLKLIHTEGSFDEDWYTKTKLSLLSLLFLMKKEAFLCPVKDLMTQSELIKIERFKFLSTYIEEHLSEPITLEELAEKTATNSQYLCRFFKEISGQSPIQYLISKRVDAAAGLLLSTNHSVLDISLDCGFANVSYFIRKFRQLKGMTPGAYRHHSENRL